MSYEEVVVLDMEKAMETLEFDEKGGLEADVVERSLAFVREEGDRQKSKRRRVASGLGGTVALIAAVALVAINAGSSTPERTRIASPPTASTNAVSPSTPPTVELKPLLAADVSQRALTSMRTTHDARGNYSITTNAHNDNYGDPVAADARHGEFVINDKGDFRETSVDGSANTQLAFQADTGTETTCSNMNYSVNAQGVVGPLTCSMQAGVPAVQPDFLDWNASLTALREAAASSTTVPLDDSTRDGRAVWKVTLAVQPQAAVVDVDTISVFVDKETNFPIGSESYFNGKLTIDIHLTSLQFNTSPKDLTVVVPKGTPQATLPAGSYKYTSLANLRNWLGHAVPVPTSVPQGFAVAQASYVSTPGSDTFNVCGNEESNFFVVTYRSGLDTFLVSVRGAKGESPECDPFGYKHESQLSVTHVTLSSGDFAGVSALAGEYDVGARLFAVGKANALSIQGDLTTDELIATANSMK